MRINELMTAVEYDELVQRVKRGNSSGLIGEFKYLKPQSIMKRYIKNVVRDYYNARRVLFSVIDKPVQEWVEEDAWCYYDYTIAAYQADNNHDIALRRAVIVRQWVIENNEKLLHLSLLEIDVAIKMLMHDKQNAKERAAI